MALTDKLTAIADAIRGKTGGTSALSLDAMVTEILGIQGGMSEQELIALVVANNWPTGDLILSDATVGTCAFYKRTDVTSLKAGNTAIGGNAFEGCTGLKSVELMDCQLNGTYHFYNCSSLECAVMRRTYCNGGCTFDQCAKLTLLDCGENISGLGSSFANGCTVLKTIILRKISEVVPITNSNAFHGTPFASSGTGGTVYVPAALIEQYQQATNWSALYAAGTCNFAAIEGSEYE